MLKTCALFIFLSLLGCTGKSSADKASSDVNADSGRPSGGTEGIPGYIVSPHKIKSRREGASFTIEAPAGVVASTGKNLADLKVVLWNTSFAELKRIVSTTTENLSLNIGHKLGNFSVNSDGSFQAAFESLTFDQEAVAVFISATGELPKKIISSSAVDANIAYQSIPELGTEATFTPVTQINQSQVIFVTSGYWDGNLGGLQGADDKCRAAAEAESGTRNLSGTWRAILSSSTVNAKDRIKLVPGTNIKNTHGEVLVASAQSLWNSPLIVGINYNQFGIQQTIAVWTGTDSTGTKQGDFCSDWNSGFQTGYIGIGSSLDFGSWISFDNVFNCNESNALFCINSNE